MHPWFNLPTSVYIQFTAMYMKLSRSFFCSGKSLYKSNICNCKIISNNLNTSKKRFISEYREIHSNKKSGDSENTNSDEHNLPSGFVEKYKVFRDKDAPIIFDVNEEKKRIELNEINTEVEYVDPYEGINVTHGINGVFDIDDLVELLYRDNARQIFVASVPEEYSYVDYIVVVTGKSPRHMHALATFIRKIFKLKRYQHEKIPKIEGENSDDWIALDLGNIALHIFSHQARLKYDLETLWSVGSEFDDISNKKDIELDIMDKYKAFLKDLQPAE